MYIYIYITSSIYQALLAILPGSQDLNWILMKKPSIKSSSQSLYPNTQCMIYLPSFPHKFKP